MFTVKITSTDSFPSTKVFMFHAAAVRCFNANKGEGFNVVLLDAEDVLLEGSKTF